MKKNIMDTVKQFCPNDFYEVGFADLSGLLGKKWEKFPYGISLLRKLDNKIIDAIEEGPTKEYFEHYNRINEELNKKSIEIAGFLEKEGIDAYAVKATVQDSEIDEEYRKTLRFPISHKMVATRAGLGWIGKTDLLVSHRFGPRIRLASVLVSLKITEPGSPLDYSLCGNCMVCVSACPAKTATGETWQRGFERERFYDAFKCRLFARQISAKNLNEEISLCGICVSVCPKGK